MNEGSGCGLQLAVKTRCQNEPLAELTSETLGKAEEGLQKGTHLRDSYSQRPEKRVWDLDVEATLLSFPKSGKGVVWEQLTGAHFVWGEANAL